MAAGGQGEGGGDHARDAAADPQDVGAELVGEGPDGGIRPRPRLTAVVGRVRRRIDPVRQEWVED